MLGDSVVTKKSKGCGFRHSETSEARVSLQLPLGGDVTQASSRVRAQLRDVGGSRGIVLRLRTAQNPFRQRVQSVSERMCFVYA